MLPDTIVGACGRVCVRLLLLHLGNRPKISRAGSLEGKIDLKWERERTNLNLHQPLMLAKPLTWMRQVPSITELNLAWPRADEAEKCHI